MHAARDVARPNRLAVVDFGALSGDRQYESFRISSGSQIIGELRFAAQARTREPARCGYLAGALPGRTAGRRRELRQERGGVAGERYVSKAGSHNNEPNRSL